MKIVQKYGSVVGNKCLHRTDLNIDLCWAANIAFSIGGNPLDDHVYDHA